tara:strand:- start:11577 stop:12755 length:1179 start_codon:yes stop_codon:yes gene_type:complete
MSVFNVNQQHPLQPREQTYLLDRKLLTVHSEDRDKKKWPYANNFEIILPEAYQNIQSMRLVEASMPVNYYTFSNQYQNTKLAFTLQPPATGSGHPINTFKILNDNSNNIYEIAIQDGFYCPDELANEIKNKMNRVISYYISDISGSLVLYDRFNVYYDNVGQKMWFGNSSDKFSLLFAKQMLYDLSFCEQPNVWNRYTKWGLGSYIGFEKKNYSSLAGPRTNIAGPPPGFKDASGIVFDYTDPPTALAIPIGKTNMQYIKAPLTIKIMGENTIYMEVEKYNSYDELMPYSENTSNLYGNDYNGIVNSAFAKIPLTTIPHGETWESRNGLLQNLTVFDPPLERIQKLKFKFRYHDGRLVDFQDFPFDFTIAFNRLKNEIGKCYHVRIPATIRL